MKAMLTVLATGWWLMLGEKQLEKHSLDAQIW